MKWMENQYKILGKTEEEHLLYKYQKAGKTIIMGHRGGFFGPENSMKSVRGAVENNLDGIEFDVWPSKDRVPMVLHGGGNGELSKYGLSEKVFNWT